MWGRLTVSDHSGAWRRLAVFVLLIVAVGAFGIFVVEMWWVTLVLCIIAVAAYGGIWFLWKHKLPGWRVQWWMHKHELPPESKDMWLSLSRKLPLSSLEYVPSAEAVVSVYRHDLTRLTEDAELTVLVRALQVPEVAALGEDVRPILATMYRRARGAWNPKPESLVKWLSRANAIRESGVPTETLVAYLKALRPDAAFDALDAGLPIEYAVVV